MRKYKIKRFLYEHYITLQPSSVSGNFSAKMTIEYFSREVPFPMGDFYGLAYQRKLVKTLL